MTDVKADAVLKFVRNLEVGMVTTDYGPVLAIEPHHRGSYFNVTWDATGALGERPVTYSHPAGLLVTVLSKRHPSGRFSNHGRVS